MSLILLGAVGCGGAGPVVGRASAEAAAQDPCLLVRAAPDGEPADGVEGTPAVPAGVRLAAVEVGDPQGTHDVEVALGDGAVVRYPEAFHAVSGGSCGWSVTQTVTEAGRWLVLVATGEHYIYEQSQCLEAGPYAQLAVFDRDRGAVVATVSCEADGAPRVTTAGERLVISGCRDGRLALSAAELDACVARR
ncbi:MAG: hypothetical protein IT385_17620 [Deltaproteobacteria bacterium]|nr:hypothetical protein [Deltaproteobacteria bacterium]